jgi:pentatricopeptide repeat protein
MITVTIKQVLQESSVLLFSQELCVLAVFLVSYLVWRHFRRNGAQPKNQKLPSKTAKGTRLWNSSAVGNPSESAGNRASDAPLGFRQRQVFASSSSSVEETMQPSLRAAEQQMLSHLEQREFTRALNMYRALERDGRDRCFGEELFSAFIQSAIRVGKIDVVERMLRAMKRNQIEPSIQFWQTTLRMLSSRKNYGASLSVYTLFQKQIPPDKVVFSCLINAALEVGAPERAVSMLERYGECELDAKDHILFFRTYVAVGDVESAETIFRRLDKETTTLMLNLLLLTCVNTQQADRAADIVRLAHEVHGESPIVDIVSYNTVIKGFAQAGNPKQCFACLHDMLEHDLDPDDITFGTLLDACIADNDMTSAHEIVNLLTGRKRPMDTVMCTLFIKGLVRANCLPHALGLYEEMKARDSARPDIITYSVLIKALVDRHDLERALQLLEDLIAAGHAPDDIILTHLLEGCRHVGNHALGKKLFEDLLNAGVKPSEFTLVTMLKLHGRCGAHKEAYELVSTWEERHGTKPSVIHYTCIISGCLRTKNYDLAWAAYELMCRTGVIPDETAVSTLLPGLVAAQQWERVIHLVRATWKSPQQVTIPTEALNNALSQMLSAGQLNRHAVQLHSIMKEAGIPITARNAKRLGP